MASAVFKTVVTTPRVVRWVRFPHALATALAAALAVAALVALPSPLRAQQDAPRRAASHPPPRPLHAPPDTIPDSLRKPPISPRRAMILSLLVPGAAQARLRRPDAAMLFATFEVVSLAMARKSAQDLREAKQAGRDSIPTQFTYDASGAPVPTAWQQNRLAPRVKARHAHYEDWIAALIFNHIIAAADAYVAANLWDFRANVSLDPARRVASVRAALPF